LGGVVVVPLDLKFEVQGSNLSDSARPHGGLPTWPTRVAGCHVAVKHFLKLKEIFLKNSKSYKNQQKKINNFLLKINMTV